MKEFSIEELKRRPNAVLDAAQTKPVMIKHRDRVDLVLMTKAQFDKWSKK